MTFGIGETSTSFGESTVDVSADDWIEALTRVRDAGYAFFDWLTGVDDLPEGFFVVAHLYDPVACDRVLVRTWIPAADPRLPSAVTVYRGANWHERETYEMFGITFTDHPYLVPLLLPDGFEGHPLRKDFILAARVAKPWPGAKEPGESHAAPSRRKTLPPGVPTDWGPTTPPNATDSLPDAAPRHTTDSPPEAAPRRTTESAPEAAPRRTTDSAPEAAPEVAPGSASDGDAGAAPGSRADQDPNPGTADD